MLFKLDSTENPRLFEKYPAPPIVLGIFQTVTNAEFFQKAPHCLGGAGFGRKSFIFEKKNRCKFHSSGEGQHPLPVMNLGIRQPRQKERKRERTIQKCFCVAVGTRERKKPKKICLYIWS